MKIGYAYCIFCDENGLKRLDATPEEHIHNLSLMVKAVADEQERKYEEIKKRCPLCGGTGKQP